MLEQKHGRRILTTETMFILTRDRERDRFYLLPGMGGKAFRRKQRVILMWAIAAGLLVSAALGWVMFLLSRQ